MRALYPFYFFNGAREIIPIYPLYAIMFTERGISALELSYLFAIWAAVGLIFEIPSGALADRFSRKWLIVISSFLKSAGFLLWFVLPSFHGYAIGFVLWGLGSTLRSGAWEALIYDLLAARGRSLEFAKHYGRLSAVGTSGVVLGELGGGLLITFGYDAVLLVSAALPIIATIPFAIAVREPPREADPDDEPDDEPDYLTVLRKGLAEAAGSRAILYILLAYAVVIVTFGVYDEYVAPTFREKGFSLSTVAFLCVAVLMAQAAGEWLAGRFARIRLLTLFVMIGGSASALIFVPAVPGIVVVSLIAGYFFMFGLSMTLFQEHLQSEINGASRATVTSVSGMADGIGAIVWFLVFGTIASATSMGEATRWLGVIVIVLCAVFYWLARTWGIERQARH